MEATEGTRDGDGNGSGAGTGTGVETRGRAQDGNEAGSGDGNERSSGDGNGDGSGDGIGDGGGEAKKRKKPHKSCRRDVENGGDLDRKRENVDKKGSVE